MVTVPGRLRLSLPIAVRDDGVNYPGTWYLVVDYIESSMTVRMC